MTQPEYNSQSPVPVPASLLTNIMDRLEKRQAYQGANVAVEQLIVALSAPEWELRAAAVRSLGERNEPFIYAHLLDALHDEHRLVRVAAIRALGAGNRNLPLEQLLLAMRDPDWEVREMVVMVLGEANTLNVDPVQSFLRLAQNDADSHVREAALYALQCYEREQDDAHPMSDVYMHQKQFLGRTLVRNSLILVRQIPLIHKSIWLCTPLLLLFWLFQFFWQFFVKHTGNLQIDSLFLALCTSMVSAAGSAFLYGNDNDLAFELTLATPVSSRLIIASRFLLVIFYNILFTAIASALLAIVHGGTLWTVISLWLGPMLLFSSLTLSLSLMVGSWIATFIGLLVELSQVLVLHMQDNWPQLTLTFSPNWQTNPWFFLVALLLLVLAVFYVPRQKNLSSL